MKRLISLVIIAVCFGLMGRALYNMYKEFDTETNYSQIDKLYLEDIATNPQYSGIVRLLSGPAFCSGVVIDANYALTAAHCVHNPEESISVYSENWEGFTVANMAYTDEGRDIALLRGDFNNFKAYPVDFKGKSLHLKSEINVVSCGYPQATDFFCIRSKVIGNFYFLLRAQGGFLQPGMSGGPVFDQSGSIIGVNSAVNEDFLLFGPIVGLDLQLNIRGDQ